MIALESTEASVLAIPTEMELLRLQAIAPELLTPDRWASIEVVGLGPVAAAAATAAAALRHSPRQVVHLGIAGTLDPAAAPVGVAVRLDRVALDGVGAEGHGELVLPSSLGFPQVAESTSEGRSAVFETLPPDPVQGEDDSASFGLTVCAASGSLERAAERCRRFPGAVIEDMESFGVALGCHLSSIPWITVRGVSNRAGDRNLGNWRIDAALEAAATRLQELL